MRISRGGLAIGICLWLSAGGAAADDVSVRAEVGRTRIREAHRDATAAEFLGHTYESLWRDRKPTGSKSQARAPLDRNLVSRLFRCP